MSRAHVLAHRIDAHLTPDASRVVARLYLPGEEIAGNHSRVAQVVKRVLCLSDAEVNDAVERVMANFSERHQNFGDLLLENSRRVEAHIESTDQLSDSRAHFMGAVFTSEYAVEGACLCNPSVVIAPDQSGLGTNQVRVVLTLRAIGEGHVSSIEFATAIVGPGHTWRFEPRQTPLVSATAYPTPWDKAHYRAAVEAQGPLDDLAHNVLALVSDAFSLEQFREALSNVHADLLIRPHADETIDMLRRVAALAYECQFPSDIDISQQVLMPALTDEAVGMEDARLVRFVYPDGRVEYRATYTAYNQRDIHLRTLVTADLRTFFSYPLVGAAASNKGMALFPRMINGKYAALCRSDGETTSVTTSEDGLTWEEATPIHAPTAAWEIVQVGNCGPPIELPQGWLVLTHGVGPMRVYAIGAMLLDLHDPTKVLAHLDAPLLAPLQSKRDGYVPNVVYCCGGLVHDGILWIPHGVDDKEITVAWANVDELVASMTRDNS